MVIWLQMYFRYDRKLIGKLCRAAYARVEAFRLLDEVTRHIPNRRMHQIRYYGWYSNASQELY
jgi:hypothetical protein